MGVWGVWGLLRGFRGSGGLSWESGGFGWQLEDLGVLGGFLGGLLGGGGSFEGVWDLLGGSWGSFGGSRWAPGFPRAFGGGVSGVPLTPPPLPLLAVVRRCLPALSSRGGVLTVGNATSYEDGSGQLRNVSELLQGARWDGGGGPPNRGGGGSQLWEMGGGPRIFTGWGRCCRSANAVLEGRQLAMRIFEDYTVSWYWIVM